MTFKQLSNNKKVRVKKFKKRKHPAMRKCPQKFGKCLKVYTMNPKKPNSAIRKVVNVSLVNSRVIMASICGMDHSLQKHSHVLVRGGRVRDLVGVGYKVIKGKLDFLWNERIERKNKRSKYGIFFKKDSKEKRKLLEKKKIDLKKDINKQKNFSKFEERKLYLVNFLKLNEKA